MNCNIIFKIGDKKIPIPYESEFSNYPTSEEILEILTNNETARLELFSYIKDNYNPNKEYKLDVEKILENPEGLVGNCDILTLKELFPLVDFPEGINAKVLLVSLMKVGGITMSGRCITSNGEELFIIKSSDLKKDNSDVIKLANFLKIRKTLLDNSNIYDEKSDNYANLEIIRKLLNKRSIPELLLDFIENNEPFRIKYFTDSNGNTEFAFNYLLRLTRDIRLWELCKEYSDPFVNSISKLHRNREENKDTLKAIDYKELFYAINAYYPDLLKALNADTERKFKNRIKEYDFNKDLFETVIENKPLIYTLLYNLIKVDPNYKYEIHSITSDEVRLKYKFDTILSLFGCSYNEIRTFDIINPDFKGYKIYSYNDKNKGQIYLYSRNYLTENTTIHKYFNSREEVEAFLEEKVKSEKLKTNSFLKFKFRPKANGQYANLEHIYEINNSPQVYEVKSIVEPLAINIDPNTEIYYKEKELITSDDTTLLDFYNLVNSWNIDDNYKNYIISNIDNAEKAVAYIYKINEYLKFDRTNGLKLLNIVAEILNAPKVAYYINSKNNANYTLIPTNPNVIEKYKEDKSYPIIQTLIAMKEVLESKIGVSVSLLTSSEIASKFPISDFPSIDPNTSKAFICDGLIYVNTTIASSEDLLHEYSHIILGILKSNPKLRLHYETVVNKVWEESKKSEQNIFKNTYKGLSEMDIREELFAKKFADYLFNNRNPELNNFSDIFLEQELYIKQSMKTIFDSLGEEPLANTYSKTINSVFKRFSSDIATKLKLGENLDLDLILKTRKKVTYINKQIDKGEITEVC